MLGPAQMKWLKKTLKEPAIFTVFCTNVPVTPKVKPGSKDTWDGFDGERQKIFNFIAKEKIPGSSSYPPTVTARTRTKSIPESKACILSTSANPPG